MPTTITQEELNRRLLRATKRGVSGEDAQNYLQQKIKSGELIVRKPGLVENIAMEGFVKPIGRFAELGGEAIGQIAKQSARRSIEKQLQALQSQPRTKEAVNRQVELANRLQELSGPIFMSQEEAERFSKPGSAALETAKRTAGAAAFAVPVGKGAQIGKVALSPAVTRGIVQGGLAGFGREGLEETLGESLGQAAVGGVTGGVTAGVIDKALTGTSALSKRAGGSLRRSVSKPKVPASVDFVQEEKAIAEALDDAGLKGSARAKATKLPRVLSNLSNKISKKLTGRTVKTAKVMDTINSSLDDNINYDPGIAGMSRAKDKFVNQLLKEANKTKGGANITDKSLFQIKQNLGKQLGRAFRKVNGELQSPLTAQEEVGLTVWGALDDLIAQANPSVKNLTLQQSLLIKAAPGLKKGAERGIGTRGVSISTRPLQAIADVAGRTGTGIGALTGKAAETGLPQAAGALTVGSLTAPAAQAKFPSIDKATENIGDIRPAEVGGNAAARQLQTIPATLTLQLAVADMNNTGGSNLSTLLNNSELSQQQRAQVIQRLLQADVAKTGGKNAPTLVASLQKVGMDGGGGSDVNVVIDNLPSASERKEARAVADILTVVRKAKETAKGTATGPISGTAGVVGPKVFGTKETNVVDLNRDLKEILRIIRKESTGVAFSPQEIRELAEEVPTVRQQEGFVESGLERLERRMLEKLQRFGISGI